MLEISLVSKYCKLSKAILEQEHSMQVSMLSCFKKILSQERSITM